MLRKLVTKEIIIAKKNHIIANICAWMRNSKDAVVTAHGKSIMQATCYVCMSYLYFVSILIMNIAATAQLTIVGRSVHCLLATMNANIPRLQVFTFTSVMKSYAHTSAST